MSMKIKRALAALLTAVMVIMPVLAVPAAPAAGTAKYERPEPGNRDAVKTTGSWSRDEAGSWRLRADGRAAEDGWYYANMLISSLQWLLYRFIRSHTTQG